MRSRLWLIKNGVPYGEAFSLPEWDVAAYSIIFSEFEGNKFDWNAMRYVERD